QLPICRHRSCDSPRRSPEMGEAVERAVRQALAVVDNRGHRIVPLHEVEMMRRLVFHMMLGFALAVAAGWLFTLQAATTAAQFEGRPQCKEGKAFGYFIWREGDTWKVRWTTFGAEKRFAGNVIVEGDELKSFKRIDVDEERRVIRPGRPTRVVRGP